MALIDLKKATITLADGGAETLDVKIGEGNLAYTEKRNMQYLKDKGSLDTVREGDEEPVEVRMDFQWEFLSSGATTSTGTPPTIEEALKNTGNAAAWVTSSSDACEPYAVDLVVLYEPDCSPTLDETITLPDYRWETLEHDLRAGQVSSSGMSHATVATLARA